ncbi:GNAT family N-acetyltransferase [Endozoicomonas sp. SM1973]|uniref:GNAT family N-acetyltransferase n=1 Tax=Spartinivicinus marinus TaxID=2994442 RepID=A0A853I8M7_9GAMM|nr:GNAT family N-acetyltransferase [Spartinivicinus marinus]NYZ65907.1 GNAT family N-acetyltransferase [Spartinivicinus marinus]
MKISNEIALFSLTEKDAHTIFQLVENNRHYLSQFLYWVDSVHDVASTKQYINQRVNSGLPGAQWFKITFHDTTCGIFAIKSISEDTTTAEVGYWLIPQVQGQGIISKIIQDMVVYLKGIDAAKAIEFRCLEQNQGSIKVAMRAGAILLKTIPHYISLNDSLQSLKIFQLPI